MGVHKFSPEGQKITMLFESLFGIQLDSKKATLLEQIVQDVANEVEPSKVANPYSQIKQYFVELGYQSVNDKVLGLYESTITSAANPDEASDKFAKAMTAAVAMQKLAPNTFKKYGFKTIKSLTDSGI